VRPLVLAEKSPVPALTGLAQRNFHLLSAVAALGPGDLVVLDTVTAHQSEQLARALIGWTVTAMPLSSDTRDVRRRLAWLTRRQLPTRLAVRDLDSGARSVERLLGDAPRLIVALQSIPIALALRVRRTGDQVVYDLNDAEDVKLRRAAGEPGATGPRTRPRDWWLWLRDKIDVHAWREFQARSVAASDLTMVCSEVDRVRFAASGRTIEIPNGADLHPIGSVVDAKAPRLLFVGQLRYPPNERAAVRLAERILPLVRDVVHDATIRLVGANTERVRSLHALPGVEVTGFVDDLTEEWRHAAALVVPLGTGGGTRLKILEAMGRGVPVVSTTIGAEGIVGLDRVHLRIADADSDLAAAVAEVLTEPASTRVMVARGHELVRDHYQWSTIERRLTHALRDLIG